VHLDCAPDEVFSIVSELGTQGIKVLSFKEAVNSLEDIFMKVTKLDAKDLATVQRLYDAKDFDFSLRPGSAAVDRGVELPNITDGFTGQAPDLGALEVGRPVPVYGPRPR